MKERDQELETGTKPNDVSFIDDVLSRWSPLASTRVILSWVETEKNGPVKIKEPCSIPAVTSLNTAVLKVGSAVTQGPGG